MSLSVRDPPPSSHLSKDAIIVEEGGDGTVTNVTKAEESSASTVKETQRVASLCELFADADFIDYLWMLVGTVGALGTGAALPVFCILFGQMLDALNKGSDSIQDVVNSVAILFVIVGCGNIATSFWQVIGWTHAGERRTQRLRQRYVRALLSQEIGWFDTIGAGELSTKVADLTGKLQDGLGRKIGDIGQYGIQFIFSFGSALYLCWQLTVVLLAAFPIIAAAGAFMIQAVTAAQNESAGQYAKAGGLATEMLSGVRTVTALNAQPEAIIRYRHYVLEAMRIGIVKSFKVGFGQGLTFMASFFTYALGFWYGAKLIIDDQNGGCLERNDCLSGGTIIAVFFCVIVGASGLGQLTPPMSCFFAAKAAMGAVLEVIERKPLIDGLSDAGEKPKERPAGKIELRDVHFAYPARPHISVCNGYNLTIVPGETVALCGPSGSGKSTIMNLLLRFYDPKDGLIALDGRDIRDLNIRWLRNAIGYVGQEPVLFAGTIADNIAYGIDTQVDEESDPDVVRRRVEAAAKLANAHDFILGFPSGYDTDIGSSGFALSGGQKQRIAIARALIKRPAVLLLDEATSALDASSERVVQQSIDALAASHAQTTIVIAHRLSTIRNADRIAVIDQGRVVELGTHNELMTNGGLYADLVRLQINESDLLEEASKPKAESVVSTHAIDALAELEKANAESSAGVSSKGPASSELQQSGKTKSPSQKLDKKSESTKTVATVVEDAPTAEVAKALRKRIWSMLYQHLGWFVLGLIGAAMVGASFPIWGLLLARTQNMFYLTDYDEMRRQSVIVAERFIMLGFDCLIGYTLQYYCIGQVGHRIATILRSDFFEAIMRREIAFFDDEKNAVGALTTRLADDCRTVHEGTGETFSNQLQALFTLAAGLIIGFTASWKITLVVMATFPINIVAGAMRMKERQGQKVGDDDDKKKKKKNKGGQAQNVEASEGALISAAFTHMRTVSAFSIQHQVSEQYAKMTEGASLQRRWSSYYGGTLFGVSNAAMFLCYALLFWYGAKLITSGEIDFVQLMTAMLGLMLGALGLGQALNDLGDQAEATMAAKRIFDAIDASRASAIDGLSVTGDRPSSHPAGHIELKNVNFRYPTRPEVEVARNYSLVIEPGQVVALVGPSGGGKSTIMNLLLRYYDPLDGQVLLDGIDVKELNVRWLRAHIGYVGQEPVLFSGSVGKNIARGRAGAENDTVQSLQEVMSDEARNQGILGFLGFTQAQKDAAGGDLIGVGERDVEEGKGITDEDIIQATKASHAHDFIMKFPNKYDTDVGEGSVMVSGGQKQRIAIARALIKRPAVLLLDEATSALDAASERIVQQSIDALQQMKAQTTIVIAHRLSTIRNADKIVVVERGQVVESGTHDELVALRGLYAQLWEKQSGVRN